MCRRAGDGWGDAAAIVAFVGMLVTAVVASIWDESNAAAYVGFGFGVLWFLCVMTACIHDDKAGHGPYMD